MKQPVSRHTFARTHGTVAVYLQEGAPLTDAVWNEAVDAAWTNLRGLALDTGLHGTAGPELRVEPVYRPGSLDVLDIVLKGGPGRFYCGGLPLAWPADLRHDHQACGCVDAPFEEILKAAERQPVFVWLAARSEFLDETDLPELRDPAVQSERGSFRRTIRACVHAAAASDIPPELVGPLLAIDAVAPLLADVDLPAPPAPTNVRLTVQGAYASDENVHYRVELVGPSHPIDTYIYGVEVLWDDRAASTVTRLAADAGKYGLWIEVHSAAGFEEGQFVRLEGDGVDGQIYRIDEIDGDRLKLRRSLCREVRSLADAPIVHHQILGDEADPSTLRLRLVIDGGCKLEVGDLVDGLRSGDGAPRLPFGGQVWQLVAVEGDNCHAERTIELVPHFGLTAALSPWGDPLPLMQHARIHEHCVVVEEAGCWRPGMRVRISGKERETEADDPCWRPEDLDEGHECWPAREPLFKDEDRTITWVERCGQVVTCCESRHTTMTLRLDVPLSADHSKCCDEVRPWREIKVRRYSGHACGARLQALWPCCERTGGVCCLKPSLTLPSGLEVVLTYRGGTAPVFAAGDAWNFAARAGGWFEGRVFAPPHERLVGAAPLAMLVYDPHSAYKRKYHDIRPIPAAFDQTALLGEIAESCAELASYFETSFSAKLVRSGGLARLPRYQGNVLHRDHWQYGLAEYLYQVARTFIQSFEGQIEPLSPPALAQHPLLAVAFRMLANATRVTRHAAALSDRELSAVAAALRRAASAAAAVWGGCCGGEGDKGLLAWPAIDRLETSEPKRPGMWLALPTCPDERVPQDGDDDPSHEDGAPDDGPSQEGDEPGEVPHPDDLPKGDDPGGEPGTNPGGDLPKGDDPGDEPGTNPGGDLPKGDDPGDEPGTNPGGDLPKGDDPGDEPGPNDLPKGDNPDPQPKPAPGSDLPIGGAPEPGGDPQPGLDLPLENVPKPQPHPDPAGPGPSVEDGALALPQDREAPRVRGGSDGVDTTIGADENALESLVIDAPGVALPTRSDRGLSELSDDGGAAEADEPGVPVERGEEFDFAAIPTARLQILKTLNPSTAHKIAADWPTLGEVYAARSEGAVRREVISNVRRLVLELRGLATRSGQPSVERLAALWSRYLADIDPPPPALVLASLPAPLASEEE